MTIQLPLFPDEPTVFPNNPVGRSFFSHGKVCSQSERSALEKRYENFLIETNRFTRKSVSYQGNKGELVHGWIRFKEGFSAQLVEDLVRELGIEPGGKILEPFAGSATTLLVAKTLGIDAVGIDILPFCHLAWQAKAQFQKYDLDELRQIKRMLNEIVPGKVDKEFPHITITQGAFSQKNQDDIMFYSSWFNSLEISDESKKLLKLLIMSILEEVSYTRKDGQYLRWDFRSPKIQARNAKRIAQGKEPTKKVDIGGIPTVKEALINAFQIVVDDIFKLQSVPFRESHQELIEGNALYVLPTLTSNQFEGVISSPPYCNRYDYTRTYALELAYLDVSDNIFNLRQEQLSCTVENRSKIEALKTFYTSIGQSDRFQTIISSVQNNAILNEINAALITRWKRGDINNRGILRMVKNYFTELTFIIAELYRVCQPGASVVFVNDNVRYGGEIIPVDLLTTNLAEELGFEPVKIYVLSQRKGNSSQQMGRFGREALRKSITVWRKPVEQKKH